MLVKKPKVYISCPISVSLSVLEDTKRAVRESGGDPVAWQRGAPYSDYDIRTCDAFVIILGNNSFKQPQNNLPAGCKKELNLAIGSLKPIFLSYESSSGRYLYRTSLLDDIIAGRAGSTVRFPQMMLEITSKLNSAVSFGPSISTTKEVNPIELNHERQTTAELIDMLRTSSVHTVVNPHIEGIGIRVPVDGPILGYYEKSLPKKPTCVEKPNLRVLLLK